MHGKGDGDARGHGIYPMNITEMICSHYGINIKVRLDELGAEELIPLYKPTKVNRISEALKKKYQLAVATNRTNTIHPILTAFKLEHFFDKVVSSLDVNNPKPHPEAVFKIVNHFGIDAREAVFVGDSPVDRETALHAKVFFCRLQKFSPSR